MKQLKQLLVISQNGEARPVEIDPQDLNPGDIAIDWNSPEVMKEVLEEYTSVVIDTNDPEILRAKLNFLQRHGFPVGIQENIPANDRGRRYLDRFNNPKQVEITISERELKLEVYKACEEKAKSEGKGFVWDNATAWMVKNMMYYFGNDPACDWPLRKGLLISGNIGVGKTWLFEIFRDVSRKFLKAGGKNFKMTTCEKVYTAYEDDQQQAREKYCEGNWCFDDLGTEDMITNDYGTKRLPIVEILTHRYGKFKAYHYLTHLSTNLSPEEIRERYGERVFDRLMQMMHVVSWEGESKRS